MDLTEKNESKATSGDVNTHEKGLFSENQELSGSSGAGDKPKGKRLRIKDTRKVDYNQSTPTTSRPYQPVYGQTRQSSAYQQSPFQSHDREDSPFRRPIQRTDDQYGEKRSYSDDTKGYQKRPYNQPSEQRGYKPRSYSRDDEQTDYQPRSYNQDDEQTGYQQRSYNQASNQGGYQPKQNYNQVDSRSGRFQQRPYNQGTNRSGGYNQNQKSYNQGGYNPNQRGYNQGGNQQGGYRQGGNQQRGYQQGGYQQGGYKQGGYQHGGYQQGGYQQGNNQQGGYQQRGFQQRKPGGQNPRNPQQKSSRPYQQKQIFPKPIKYDEVVTDPTAPIRLNKYLANAGVCSRREADEFIQAGVVKVNEVVITELGTKITRMDKVTFHDQPVQIERKIYILLNKPKNCVTTSDDPQNRQTVMDLVKNACQEHIYPVGRLDRNTTGVLLLTNDGEMTARLTHPSFKKKKIYQVWVDREVAVEDMEKLANGIELDDGEIHADAISYVHDEDHSQIGIEIHSGKNRVVRRMFETLGYHVTKLDRVYFAGLTKKNLGRSRWRYLTEHEVNALRMGAYE